MVLLLQISILITFFLISYSITVLCTGSTSTSFSRTIWLGFLNSNWLFIFKTFLLAFLRFTKYFPDKKEIVYNKFAFKYSLEKVLTVKQIIKGLLFLWIVLKIFLNGKHSFWDFVFCVQINHHADIVSNAVGHANTNPCENIDNIPNYIPLQQILTNCV